MMKKMLFWILITLFVVFLGFVAHTFSSIFKSVESITQTARSEFPGDAVHALIDMVNSDRYDYQEKNTAIWAIGQYADPSALPYLEKLNAEIPADNVPFDRKSGLSKMEIERAIKWCTRGNGTSWMYRKIK